MWHPSADEYSIDFFELWDILWSGRWLIVGAGGLFTILAVVFAMRATPIYESRVVMMPADENTGGGLSPLMGRFGGLASLAGINIGGGGRSAVAIKVLTSHAFLAAFIQEEGLMPDLFPNRWDASEKNWRNGMAPTMQQAARKLSGRIRTSIDKVSGAVTVTVTWVNAKLAAQWGNALVARLNANMRAQDIDEALRASEYLKVRLQDVKDVAIRNTLYELIEAQMQTVMLANVREDYVFRIIDPAFPADRRSKPRRALIVMIGGVFGGVFGVILALGRHTVREYSRRRKTDEESSIGA